MPTGSTTRRKEGLLEERAHRTHAEANRIDTGYPSRFFKSKKGAYPERGKVGCGEAGQLGHLERHGIKGAQGRNEWG